MTTTNTEELDFKGLEDKASEAGGSATNAYILAFIFTILTILSYCIKA